MRIVRHLKYTDTGKRTVVTNAMSSIVGTRVRWDCMVKNPSFCKVQRPKNSITGRAKVSAMIITELNKFVDLHNIFRSYAVVAHDKAFDLRTALFRPSFGLRDAKTDLFSSLSTDHSADFDLKGPLQQATTA